MSRICGYRCEHNKSGICQISVCDKKSNMQASCEASIINPKKQLEFYKQLSEQLQQENKKQKEIINKVTNDLQQIIDNVKDRTIISLGQFIPKLEIIQDELNGSNDILKEVSE